MFVKDYMTRHPIMVGPQSKIFEAQELMSENSIRHLPVVGDGKRLMGLITRQRLQVAPEDLGSLEVWEITRYLSNLTVSKVMLKGNDLHTINQEATLEEAADMMIRFKIGGLPVLGEDEEVVGVITETDLLLELRELLGATDPGWRIVVRIPSRVGEYARLTGAISARKWAIMAMGSVRTPKDEAHWDMVLKVTGCEKEELRSVVDGITEHELIDIRHTVKI